MEKTIIFNKKEYKDYRDMYADIYEKFDGKENYDFDFCKTPLGYSADTLNEFLWYYHNDNLHIILLNFDRVELATPKTYDDYKYNLILEVFEDFVKEYPNNSLEYRNEE